MADKTTPDVQFHPNGPGHYNFEDGPPTTEQPEDLVIDDASLRGLVNFVAVRAGQITAASAGSHLRVSERERWIQLVLNEHGGHQPAYGTRTPATRVTGTLQFGLDHAEVKALMGSKWSAENLSAKMRASRHLFADDASWRAVWTKLRDTSFEVKRVTEAFSNDAGARKKGFDEQIVNADKHQMQFGMRHAIFEDTEPRNFTYEVMFQIVNGEVQLSIICDTMLYEEREIVKTAMAAAMKEVCDKLPEGALPVIYLN